MSQETVQCALKYFFLEVSTASLKRYKSIHAKKNLLYLISQQGWKMLSQQLTISFKALFVFVLLIFFLKAPQSAASSLFSSPWLFPCTSLPLTPGSFDHLRRSLLVLLRTAAAVCVCVCVCVRSFCLILQWAAAEDCPQPVCFGPLPLSDLDLVTKMLWMSGKLVHPLHAVNDRNVLSFLFKYH